MARGQAEPTRTLPGYRLQRVNEPVLDWAYPVHTLDVAAVVSHHGRKFQQLRTEINKLDHSRLAVVDLEPAKHRAPVLDVVAEWSDGDYAVAPPYMRLLDLFRDLPLRGRMIFEGGRPAGFSIWEETSPDDGMANAYAHVGRHDVEGLSRFVIVDMCRYLEARGFTRVCVGGFETAGLDQFKRQLRPANSVSVGTWQLMPLPPALRPVDRVRQLV